MNPVDTMRFLQEFAAFKRHAGAFEPRFTLDFGDRWPCMRDRTGTTPFDRHYIYHPAWAARVLAETRPAEHVDISSSLAFCTLVSAFVPVKFYDFRPADLRLSGLSSHAGDLMRLPFETGSVPSISCMHVIEHIGLGRYGDPVDYNGDLAALAELRRVTAPGGSLLLVVPVGQARIQFNAHRIYRYRQIVEAMPGFTLRQFALIPDNDRDGGLVVDASEAMSDQQRDGCGCFWFVKDGVTAAGALRSPAG